MVLVSNSRRPIRVLLPSSTLPQVRKRSRPRSSTWGRTSEVTFFLALFHRGLAGLVVQAGGAALGDGGGGGFEHDLLDGVGIDSTGAVQEMSPTVRKRTSRSMIDFAGLGRLVSSPETSGTLTGTMAPWRMTTGRVWAK
jgi:hypothetical protein